MQHNNNNKFISIEGNIGSGKSTLLQSLKKYYKNSPDIIFIDEPVNQWENIKDENGISMLQKFYTDPTKYAFSFQMMAYISRLSLLKKVLKENSNSIIISERCLYTDKFVFAKMLYDNKQIEHVNYLIYSSWFDEFINDFKIDGIIYIKTNPNKCNERIVSRGRNGESSITLEYLKNCNKYHEDFLNINNKNIIESPQLILDGNIDIYTNNFQLNDWILNINTFIYSL